MRPMTAKMTVYLDLVSIHGETSRREILNVVHFNEGRKIIQVTSAEDPNNRSSRYTVYGFDMSTILAYEIDCIPDAEGSPIPDNDWWGIENSDIPMPMDPMDQLVKDEEDEYGEEN
jgi:hypothetical protein